MSLRLARDITDDDRYTAWVRVVERICTEQINQAWSYYMFRLVRAVFDNNTELSTKGGFIADWMIRNYVDATLMFLRRELDKQAGTENLRNLLYDIIEHPAILTRARYCRMWSIHNRIDKVVANRTFDSFKPRRISEDPTLDHIDPDVVKADLEQVINDARKLQDHAERTRAHRSPGQGVVVPSLTFDALHKAISDIRNIVGKYYALLTLTTVAQWQPTPQYNTITPFTKPWVIDPKAISAAIKETEEN